MNGGDRLEVREDTAARPRPSRGSTGPLRIGFLWHLGYKNNIRAVQRLYRRVYLPLKGKSPNLRLKIIGRAPSSDICALRAPEADATGEVKSIWPHLAEVDVMVFPMELGSGMRHKILAAAGCPVVRTPICAVEYGSERADAPWVAETDNDTREATASLLRERSPRILTGIRRGALHSSREPVTL